MSSFLDSVKNISNAEVLQYWSAILKGELEVPGQMPLAIIDILRNLDKDTAILFEKAWQFRCNNWVFYGMDDSFPIILTELNQLIQHDLVLPILFGQHTEIGLDKNGWGSFKYGNIKILIEKVEGEGIPQIPHFIFTTTALLLGKTIAKKCLPNKVYLTRLAEFVGTKKVRRATLGLSDTGRFRLWVSMQNGNHILIDTKKSDSGIDFSFADDGKFMAISTQSKHPKIRSNPLNATQRIPTKRS